MILSCVTYCAVNIIDFIYSEYVYEMKKMPTADQVQYLKTFMNEKHKILKANSAAWFNKAYKT